MPDLQNLSAPAGLGDVSGSATGGVGDMPMGSPMSTPQEPKGNREDALINVHMALDLLEGAVAKLGSETPEGQIVMKSLGSLTKVFGGKRSDSESLGNTEIQGLLNRLPQAGGGQTPEAQALAQQQPGTPPQQPMGMPQGMPSQQAQPQPGAM